MKRGTRYRHPNRFVALLGVFALLATFGTAAAGADGRVRTDIYLDPADVVGLDELTVLEIKISIEGDSVPSIPDPVFQLENFRQVEGPSQSTGLTTVDGRRLASRTLTWKLKPWRTGRARVHSASVTIEGQKIDIDERRVDVVRNPPPDRRRARRSSDEPFDRLFSNDPSESVPLTGGVSRRSVRPPRRRGTAEAPRIVLRAEVSPSRPYVGQQTLYTLNLYTQVDIHSVNPEEFPDFKGFWARVIPQPDQQPEMVHYDGESFGRVILIQRALFPRRAGTFDIEAIAARMLAQIPERGTYGSLLPKSREIVRQSNPAHVRVRDLPPPPPGFQGAVGSIRLEAGLEPAEIEVGEAATLTLRLQGRAHLQGVQAPQLPEFPGIRVFPPQQQSEESLRGNDVYASRTWSFVLVPEDAGDWELPPIEVPYFDPKKERYRVAASAPLSLKVAAASRAADSARVKLHPIRDDAAPAKRPGWDLSGFSPWLFGLPWTAAVALLWMRHREEAGGTRVARRRLLVCLGEAALEERPRQAAAKIEEAWREFLHAHWQIPLSSPSTQWGHLLTERGVDARHAETLVKLADDLHYLRYAPKLSSITELREELLERSRKLARVMG